MEFRKKHINFILGATTFFALGSMLTFSYLPNIGMSSSHSATLDRYPIDLSISGYHNHDKIYVKENVPNLSIEAHKDKMMPAHVNLELETENFEFAPENISDGHIENTGHAHVYVDDVLISRTYGDWYHIPRLEPGTHEIRVTLNTNNHREYAHDNKVIEDTETVKIGD